MQQRDPYEILGVPRGASPEQIRQAYRRAVLKYHPDNCPGDPAEAVRRFCQLAQAYRTVCRLRGRTLTPGELSQLEGCWFWAEPGARALAAGHRWRHRPGARKLSYPSHNENLVFACFWVLAVMVAILVGLPTGTYLAERLPGLLGGWKTGLLLVVVLGAYASVLAATIAVLVLSRKVVWVIFRLGLAGLRLLPRPQDQDKLPQ